MPERMEYPLVSSVSELSVYLKNVAEKPYKTYTHIADPPCHGSKSGKSFHFGDSGEGLVIGCWAGCQKGDWPGMVEDTLKVRLRLRREDGSYRWGGGAAEGKETKRQWKPKEVATPAAMHLP